ncbi:Peroxidase 4 [Zea mays]|uniref:Peroxidase n=2 Tax=Zea mays TaxID=4577 RepID=K7VV24_MAIZE|nr:peroxidase 4 [Zea mays]AQL03622.1 Peroxidase 52 [Zea mays]PWZ04737.1 Peroxidase 4 [Zea mays]|eukprot:XP_008660905.1 peroxidase 4 [Zea mays]
MSPSRTCSWLIVLSVLLVCTTANGDRLKVGYYDKTCPDVQQIVQSVMAFRVGRDQSVAPAVLRLFFHDCFVDGCDGSVLLDETPFFESEKDATPNANSLHGFDVIDEIKSYVEHACPATVSCADILALASRDAVALLGGPSWKVQLGRKDSRVANRTGAEYGLPAPNSTLAELINLFKQYDLDARDMAALSGAHTIGTARCHHYRDRVYGYNGEGGADIDPSFAELRRQTCQSAYDAPAPFDEQTPMRFDNAYYRDLVGRRGLLTSDQALYGYGGPLDHLVKMYSTNGEAFAKDFAKAIVKMGKIPPPHGMQGEIRLSCSKINR